MRCSVIIPTYNRASELPEAVESVLAQTHSPMEVIVVDDGSTDETPRVCERLPSEVRIIVQENAGVSAARNRGVDAARGEFVAFLDSDDRWVPEKLAIQGAVFEALPRIGWTCSGCTVVDLASRPLSASQSFEGTFPVFRERSKGASEWFGRFLRPTSVWAAGRDHEVFEGEAFELLCYGNTVLPSSLVVRRQLYLDVGGFDPSFRVAEETEFAHRLSLTSPVAIVMSPLVTRTVGAGDALTASDNTVELTRCASRSLEAAVRRRAHLTVSEAKAYKCGSEALILRQAYAEISRYGLAEARRAILTGWRQGMPFSVRSMLLFSAALLPEPALRAAHRLKPTVRRLLQRRAPERQEQGESGDALTGSRST